ncbi:MAG: pyruvate kinase, partial [Anaerolineaceae bacterium]|nr:pyruvate kinase [Anaerolineaceae bacterium]
MERFAKIVCTLGPSSESKKQIMSLVKAGMNVARLNFSHGTHEEHLRKLKIVREVSNELNTSITILQDLQGPKLRIGVIPQGTLELKVGDEVTLSSSEDFVSGSDEIYIPFEVPDLHKAVQPGNHILLDDGQLEMEVTKITGDRIDAVVTLGGTLKSNKGVNLPGANLTFPSFTEKDRADLKFGLEQGVDMVAISFVKTAEDVQTVRTAIEELASLPAQKKTPIIAKLERPEALQNLEAIMQVTDG